MRDDWISRTPYAAVLDERARHRLSNLSPRSVARGSVLFRPGDRPSGFLLVLSGRIGVFLVGKSGREILLYAVEPGETCIQTTVGLIGGRSYTGEAIAETDLEVIAIPAVEFAALMNESEAFRSQVFSAFGDRFSDITRVLEQVAFVSVEQRIARELLDRADADNRVVITHGDLATAIGSSREVVSRRLERFKRQGVVALERGEISILNRPALAGMLDAD